MKAILFKPKMSEAIRAGKKTQTRRQAKPQPEYRENDAVPGSLGTFFHGWNVTHPMFTANDLYPHFPYGQIGDRLWVKETFYALGQWVETFKGSRRYSFIRTKSNAFPSLDMCVAFPDTPPKQIESKMIPGVEGWYKRPSIFLPRKDSRTTLEVVGYKFEQLQKISNEDAIAEGIKPLQGGAVSEFRVLWDSINKNWDDNPWVWVVEFRMVAK
jgi:hypothetical protein